MVVVVDWSGVIVALNWSGMLLVVDLNGVLNLYGGYIQI